MIIPLFKTHYSIGKSILTLSSETEEDTIGPNSVIDLAVKNNISDLFFNIDIKNYKLILEKISQLKIRPLKYLSICNEAGIQSEIILNYLNMNRVSNINEYLNKYLFLTNKYHQKKLFKKNTNFQLPKFQIFNFKNKDNYFNFKNKVILKPSDSSGSRGIIVKNKLSKISFKSNKLYI